MTKSQLNNIRLAIKGLVTLWVPVLVLSGAVSWSPELVAAAAAASTASVDLVFRIWEIGDAA